jgi:hypothetical protein
MRPQNLSSAAYQIGDPGQANSIDQLTRYIREMEERISVCVNLLALGHLDATTVAPAKPRDGDFRHADGTLWNPGSGKGFYRYDGNSLTWIFIG